MHQDQVTPQYDDQGVLGNFFIRHWGGNRWGIEREWFEPGEVLSMKKQLTAIERVVQRVVASGEPASSLERTGFRFSETGRAVWRAMEGMRHVPEEVLEGRRLSPLLRRFIPLLRKWWGRLRSWTSSRDALDLDAQYPRRMMDHVLYVIRRVSAHPAYKAELAKGSRRANDRYSSCVRYALRLFEAHPKLLVLRVDLYFEGVARLSSQSPEAKQAYDRLLSDLSEGRVIPGVIGYIAVSEDGLERRLHHHLMVFCDGQYHQNGYHLSESIGNYWVGKCVGTRLLASFKNCWVRRREYRFNALGVVHYTDSRMIMGLREALEYMCKDEGHTYLSKGYGKGLRKGQSPRRSPGARRGAPRKHDLSVAEVVLLTKADPVPKPS